MKLIKKYLKELKSLKADEVNGRSVTKASNAFYKQINKELYELALFMLDMNNTARAYSKSIKNNTTLEYELNDINMRFNFDKATQKELREKMAETFKEVFKF